FIPLAAINPAFPDWEGDLSAAIGQGFCGVAVYPNYHSYTLEHRCTRDLFDALADEGLFVRVHVRMQDERLHHPVCGVDPVDISPLPGLAAEVPSVGVLIANATNAEWPVIAEGLRATDNLFMDLSHVERVGGVRLLAENVGVESVAFGTHAPLQYAQAAVLKIREAGLEEPDGEAILHENASAWMRG
ncbi:MAG: amidohydrolase family protein, partial [Armatimonadota bacterium]